MKVSVLSAAKFAVAAVVGIGTGKIVERAIKSAIPAPTLIDKITITAATWVIAGIATEVTKKYTDDMVEDIVESVNEIVRDYMNNKKLERINQGETTFEQEGLDPSRFAKTANNIWVFKDSFEVGKESKELDAPQVLEILKSGEWKYVNSENSWQSVDRRGKVLSRIEQLPQPGGKIKWVMIR